MSISQIDEKYMRRAFALARRGAGMVSPNPLVGAVVVKNDRIIGEGYHRAFKQPHAEKMAIVSAGRMTKDATLYVNLEPCCHWGHNPPCTDAIINAGIRRVVFSNRDPQLTKRQCSGAKVLKEAGIEVISDCLQGEGYRLNEKYFYHLKTGCPFITLKMAMTVDGKIADRDGCSQWLSGERSRRKVQQLRREHDAVMVGIGTVLKDDPKLTIHKGRKRQSITKIIIDPQLRISPGATLFDSGDPVVILCHSSTTNRHSRFPAHTSFITIKDREDFSSAFEVLGKMGITSILSEGGGKIAAALMEQDLIQRYVFVVTPHIAGDIKAISVFHSERQKTLSDFKGLVFDQSQRLEKDIWLQYLPESMQSTVQ